MNFKLAFNDFIQLAERYFDAPTIEFIKVVGKRAVDSSGCREWCQTIFEMRDFCKGTEPVPNSSFISHLDIDQGNPGRIPELLFWQLFGVLAKPGVCMQLPVFNLPQSMVLGGLGVLCVKQSNPSTICTQLDWRGDTPILKSQQEILQTEWIRHLSLVGPGLNCVIPLENRALTAAKLQDFPIVSTRGFSEQWGSAVLDAAIVIKEYSEQASHITERFVKNVLALICGDEAIGSASRQEALGLIFLPAVLDRCDQLVECLLHEAMHQYLFRLEACARLFDQTSPSEEVFYSPWRRDKRPLRMTLHGSFVFAAVADFYLWVAKNPQWGLDHSVSQMRVYQRYRESSIALDVVRKYGVMSKIGDKVLDALEADLADIRGRIDLRTDRAAEVDQSINDHLNEYDKNLH